VASNLCWKTRKENNSDKVLHGTQPRGSRIPVSKLTEDGVARIREARLFGADINDLASTYGVVRETIRRVINRNDWRHV
jgi:hypothetical protein